MPSDIDIDVLYPYVFGRPADMAKYDELLRNIGSLQSPTPGKKTIMYIKGKTTSSLWAVLVSCLSWLLSGAPENCSAQALSQRTREWVIGRDFACTHVLHRERYYGCALFVTIKIQSETDKGIAKDKDSPEAVESGPETTSSLFTKWAAVIVDSNFWE